MVGAKYRLEEISRKDGIQMVKKDQDDLEPRLSIISIPKFWAIAGAIGGFLVHTITLIVSLTWFLGTMRQDIAVNRAAVDTKFAELETKFDAKYARKEAQDVASGKLDRIAESLAEMKGYFSGKQEKK